jgi:uncharacterized membrane protein YfcA
MHYDLIQLTLFAGGAFVAALVAGVSGFAFAPLAASVWLHLFTPIETAALTVGYNILVQGYGTWRTRHAFDWARLWPLVLGGLPGVVLGISALRLTDPAYSRIGIAAFLVLYALYGIFRPIVRPIRGGVVADCAAGFAGGMLGSMAGFPGILVVVWCTMRGWSKDEQRAVFQPVSVALLVFAAATLIASGSFTRPIAELFLMGLPAVLLGTWAGFRLYGRVNEAMFRRLLLSLLLMSGVLMLASIR